MKIMQSQKNRYGTMTTDERRMNHYDSNHYQSNEIDALIPGLNNLNTVGSSPLKRGAK
jgi:hypothetical protein